MRAARLHGREGALVRLKLPGILSPIWGRARTSDVETFEEVFVGREYDLPFSGFDPALILDLGANVGYTSVFFATRWPDAEILAVEPSLTNVEILRRNTSAWPRIHPLHAAVWSRPANVHIANPDAAPNAFRVSEAGGARSDGVDAYTVPQLLKRLGDRSPVLVKIDIEGAETEIFADGAAWLDAVSVVIIELHDQLAPGCAQAFYRALCGRPFQQVIVGQNLAVDLRSKPPGMGPPFSSARNTPAVAGG